MEFIVAYVFGLIFMVILLSITRYDPEVIMTLSMCWPFVLLWLCGYWIKEHL